MNNREKVAKNFCTTREAAEMLGISLKTAQLWTENGLLEAWKTEGGHRRINRESVLRLLAAPGASSPVAENSEQSNVIVAVTTAQPETKFRILVAEDDTTLLTLYSLRLSKWSMAPQVVLVSDGFQALLEIGRQAPDMLITDLNMPEMDGFRMLQTLAGNDELKHMRIVAVSGLDDAEIRQHGGLSERVRLLPKPIPFHLLEQIANEAATEKAARNGQRS